MNKLIMIFRNKVIPKNLLLMMLSVTIIGTTTSTYAAIALDRTRVVFDGSEKSVTLNISNQNKQLPYLAQGWIEDDKGNKINSPLIVLPPVQRIEPGASSQIKIQSLSEINKLKQDRETVYYFNLREIPPKSTKANTLQIALQTRIKLFYRPSGIAMVRGEAPPQNLLTLNKQGGKYIVNNPTPYYVSIVNASNKKNSYGVKNFEPMMVAPKSSLPLTVDIASLGNNPVLTYVNDYGGRPQLSFNCKGNICTVIPENKE
ncbi:UNVERIFIED_ORG: P pilus assembly chaperone PapD [Providencia alcalifaciens]